MALTRGEGTRLERLERVATEAGAVRLASEARALSERVRDGRFYVAGVGQFKRGKSTLLNALLGQPLLSVGVVPVTAVVTMVRYGEHLSARVRFAEGGWREIAACDLPLYVTEDHNPENRAGVAGVEVFVPSALLASGMCLVDTPGIGSVFAGNTDATRSFLPHVDAAIVILGADPPISADELALVQRVAEQRCELLFVLNKADKLTEEELEQAGAFTRRVLHQRAGVEVAEVFAVSATEQLAGRGSSGWSKLTEALTSLARRSGSDLAQAAEVRGIAHLSDRLLRALDEQRGALLRPVAESERRAAQLRACVEEAERALLDLGPLFAAEQERLARLFSENRQRFLDEARPVARAELMQACRAHPARRGPALRRAAIDLAKDIAMRHLDAWLAEAEAAGEQLYARAMDRFVELGNAFLAQVRATGDAAMAGLAPSVDAEVGFRWDSRLFYKDRFHSPGQRLWTSVADRFRTREATLRSVERDVGAYLVSLLETNATRIDNDLNERVLESRRRFAFELRALLHELVASATSSLDRAKEVHAQGSQAVQSEVERIGALRARVEALSPGGEHNPE